MGQSAVSVEGTFRAPSLVRRPPRERVGKDSAIESPAAMGMERGNLAIKIQSRKHMSGGSRMVRG